jgi:GAF domain-containing protein
LHATEDRLERVAAWGDASLSKPSFALQDCWAMRRSQIHYVGRTDGDLACGHIIKAAGNQQSICMPLVARGNVFGLLHLQHFRNRTNPSEDEESADPSHDLVTMVGEELSYAFANIRLRESLHEKSLRDPLTGLFNRRFVEEYLRRELARAERKARQLSVIALDIDHFKHFNDTFGHGAGDVVLQHVGVVLQAHVRSSDVACRVGGEEFMLLLAESPL